MARNYHFMLPSMAEIWTYLKPSKRNGAALIKSAKPYSSGVLEGNKLV